MCIAIKQYEKLNIEYMHQFTQGEGIKVAVLDSEISPDHPEFIGKDIAYQEFIPSTMYNYHGTAVSSLIAGNTIGVAPNVELYHMKILSDVYGSGVSWDKAVTSAMRQKVDLICMSIGTKDTLSTSMKQSLQNAKDRGIIISAPSGNEGRALLRNPAENGNVIAVSGLSDSGRLSKSSNYSTSVEAYAPSEDIIIADSSQPLLYTKKNGTSFANAIFIGQMALLLSYAKQIGVSIDVRAFLKQYYITYRSDGRFIDMKKIKLEVDKLR